MHWGFGFWPLVPIFWIGLILFVCWGASRWFGWEVRRRPMANRFDEPPTPNAMEILRQRYAQGEIDITTFEQMREQLEQKGKYDAQ